MIGWNALDYLSDLLNCNVAVLHTHGNTSFVWSDANDYWFEYNGDPGSPRNIYPLTAPSSDPNSQAVLPWRSAAVGTGLPPYNSTQKPAINLVHLATCEAGATNDFAEGYLTPCGNYYKPSGILIPGASVNVPENQALVGLAITIASDQNGSVAQAFWEAMGDGWDVDRARRFAFDNYQGANKPPQAEDFMLVWGDFYMRLTGVYTQSAGQESRWYCDIP